MMIERGFASRNIAAKLGCGSHTTILRLKKKYEETGNVEDKPRSSRSQMLNERYERTIIRRLMNGECSNAISLTKSLQVNENIEISADTVRRVLRKNSFISRVKHKKPLLSKKHQEKRLKFAKRFKDWIISNWSKVV
jgi:transposase